MRLRPNISLPSKIILYLAKSEQVIDRLFTWRLRAMKVYLKAANQFLEGLCRCPWGTIFASLPVAGNLFPDKSYILCRPFL